MFLRLNIVLLWLAIKRGINCVDDKKEVEELVAKWSPLVWLAPDERFLPLSAEEYLRNVRLAWRNGTAIDWVHSSERDALKEATLMPNVAIDDLMKDSSSFIYGKNPNLHRVSTYAFVEKCTKSGDSSLYFHVSYWLFFPYNEGKQLCFIGSLPTLKIFKSCLGRMKTLGNHLGDWEHMSLTFSGKPYPDRLYLAVHDTGVYYTYVETGRFFRFSHQRKGIVPVPKFPPTVWTHQGQHPVIFSANGSHGLWSAPGNFPFVALPKLTDRNGYGTPWKTWTDLEIYHLDDSRPLPVWITYRGKWGNSKKKCYLLKKLGICEYSDGPVGPSSRKKDFSC